MGESSRFSNVLIFAIFTKEEYPKMADSFVRNEILSDSLKLYPADKSPEKAFAVISISVFRRTICTGAFFCFIRPNPPEMDKPEISSVFMLKTQIQSRKNMGNKRVISIIRTFLLGINRVKIENYMIVR